MIQHHEARTKRFPLTEAQKRIFSSQIIRPESGLNNICVTYYVKSIEVETLRTVVRSVIQKHEVFGMRLGLESDVPYQVFLDQTITGSNGYPGIDEHEFDSPEAQAQWETAIARQPFVLYDSPLYYVCIIKTKLGATGFLLKTHHLISDAWTHQILIDDVYRELCALEPDFYPASTLVDPEKAQPAPFSECVVEDLEWTASQRCIKERDELLAHYSQLPSRSGLVMDQHHLDDAAQRFTFELDAAQESLVQEALVHSGVSAPLFFLIVYTYLLGQHCQKDQILMGTLGHGRATKASKTCAGMFVSTVVMNLPTFYDRDDAAEMHTKIEQAFLFVLRRQRVPVSLLNRHESVHGALLDTLEFMYTYEHVSLALPYNNHFCGYEIWPLLVRPSKRGGGVGHRVELDYRLDCFSQSWIEAFAERYRTGLVSWAQALLQLPAGKPSSFPLSRVTYVPRAEREQVNTFSTGRHVDFRLPAPTLHGCFAALLPGNADRIAVSDQQQSLTWRALDRLSSRVAQVLLDGGVRGQEPVALYLERSVFMMVSILGVLKAGAAWLPLSLDAPLPYVQGIVEASGARFLLTTGGRNLEGAQAIDVSMLAPVEGDWNVSQVRAQQGNTAAYVIFTSGSTGRPKGVVVEHNAILNRLYSVQKYLQLGPDDVIMQKTPYTFDVSVGELFGWLPSLARLHFLPPGGEKEPDTIVEQVYHERVSSIHFVPSMLEAFLSSLEHGASLDALSSIKHVLCSGEALKPHHVKDFFSLIGNRFGIRLWNLYGPTEAAVEVTIWEATEHEPAVVPIGRPIDNVRLYILDPLKRRLPPGIAGELWIAGVCLARGYLGQKELTDQRFVADPFVQGQRMYQSGDLARWLADGSIEYLGRKDGQVKIRGYRIELGEVESHLRTYPGVEQVVVAALADHAGLSYLVCWYRAASELDIRELKQFLLQRLPAYMIPAWFTRVDTFPTSSSGKLDVKALPHPDAVALVQQGRRSFTAPRTEEEAAFLNVWEEVLGVSGVGIYDNFFDLGGDSLKVLSVHAKIGRTYQLEIQDLFQHPSVEAQARLATQKRKAHAPDSLEHHHSGISTKALRIAFDSIRRASERVASADMSPAVASVDHPRTVLLTGATGFLGAYVLRELLADRNTRLLLPIRARDDDEAQERFHKRYEHYFGYGAAKSLEGRVEIKAAELGQPDLGLGSPVYQDWQGRCAQTVHCAALVKHHGRYEDFVTHNITATKNLLNFYQGSRMYRERGERTGFVFASTVSLGLSQGFLCEEHDAKDLESSNPYIQSKILAERLVGSVAGSRIIRIGTIVGCSKTGVFQINSEENAFYESLRLWRDLGMVPDLETHVVDITPVDICAQALVSLSLLPSTKFPVVHVRNPKTIELDELSALLGIPKAPRQQVLGEILKRGLSTAVVPYLEIPSISEYLVLCDLSDTLLGKLGLVWPDVNKEFINRLFDPYLGCVSK